jgi:hypothetical protein
MLSQWHFFCAQCLATTRRQRVDSGFWSTVNTSKFFTGPKVAPGASPALFFVRSCPTTWCWESSPFNLMEVMEAKNISVGVRRAETWRLPRVNFAMQSASLIAQASLCAGSQMHFPLHGSNGLLVQVARSSTVVSQGSRNQP